MFLSDTFKYISKFRSDGHSIGRKIGDLLEVLVYGTLINNKDFKNKLHIEPKLYGFCDSGHKVEFAINKIDGRKTIKGGEIKNPKDLIGFIECKKVGVEQTINSSFKKKYKSNDFLFSYNDLINLTIEKKKIELKIAQKNEFDNLVIKIGNNSYEEILLNNHRIILAISNKQVELIKNNKSLRDYSKTLEKCKIFEIQKKDKKFKIILNDCLAGPQTPEKAKQASFVALDVRKLRTGKFDKQNDEKKFVSILVLTEASHWEEKSRNMVRACLDKTFIIEDSIIIETLIKLETKFGENFIDLISKNEFEKNDDLKELILSIVKKYNDKIYTNLDNNKNLSIELTTEGYISFKE